MKSNLTRNQALGGTVAIGLVLTALAFGGSASANVDVVEGVAPMSHQLAGIAGTIDHLATLRTPQDRGRYLEANWPHLDEDIVVFLQDRGKIARGVNPTRVQFYYGSMKNVLAESADGNRRGYFENQLVAIVTVPGQKEPIRVLVQCLNGTFALVEDLEKLEMIGDHAPQLRFAIGRGEGLVHHLDYPAAIRVAERFHLPVYRGKQMVAKARISYGEARTLESRTDWTQVTVGGLKTGDRFDLVNGVFDPVDGPPVRG
jgi:hypothetical protein